MSDLDEESVAFLKSVQRLGGRDIRSDVIRAESGLSSDQRDRRFEKLDDRGYIIVTRGDEPINGGGFPPRYATLSDKGKRFLQNLDNSNEDDTGEDTVTVSRTQMNEFVEQLERLENRVNTITQTVLPDEPAGDLGQGSCSLAKENEEDLGEVWRVLDEPIRNRLNRLELQMQATQHLFGVQGLDFDAAVEDVRDDE